MRVAPAKPLTTTGIGQLVNVPSPSWPSLLWPHARTTPSLPRAKLCPPPAAMDAIAGRSATRAARVASVTCERPELPHVQTPPSAASASV
jgi:hypothetical protein